jgi:hypothetical protein
MPLPGMSTSLSPAGVALGLGDLLGQQVAGETEEMRKKRMASLTEKQMLGPAGSLAVTSLLGPNGGGGGNY